MKFVPLALSLTLALFAAALMAAPPAAPADSQPAVGAADAPMALVKLVETHHTPQPGDLDVESWITRAGLKLDQPQIGGDQKWIALADKKQQLFAADDGLTVEARATPKDGRFAIEITGHKIITPDHNLLLAPGERILVPLTNNPTGQSLFLAICIKPETDTSKPVVKDGLSISVTVPKKLRAADPLQFTVHYKNANPKEPITLINPQDFRSWLIEFDGPKPGPSWHFMIPPMMQLASAPAAGSILQPGETLDVPVDLTGEDCTFVHALQQSAKSPPQLAPAKYQFVIHFDFQDRGLTGHWIGQIATEPVTLEIAP